MINKAEISQISGVPDYTISEFSNRSNNYALVIPVINEGNKIMKQLEEIKQLALPVDLIIADGGSTDGSLNAEFLREVKVTTLLEKKGSGRLSAQLRMAFHYCLQNNYSFVITMDGNGKDGIEAIPNFIEAYENGFEFIQGSRYLDDGQAINTPPMRALAIKLIHAPITSLAAGFKFTDTTNGFRGFASSCFSEIKLSPFREVFSSYEFLAYAPIRAGKLKLKIKEIPVRRAYPQVGLIPTKIVGFRSHLNLLTILIKAATGKFDPENNG